MSELNENEAPVIIANPIARGTNGIVGTTRGRCVECGQEVWLAPSSQSLIADQPKTMVLCTTCGFARATEASGEARFEAAPGAFAELLASILARG